MSALSAFKRMIGRVWKVFWPQSAIGKDTAWRDAVDTGLEKIRVGDSESALTQFLQSLKLVEDQDDSDLRIAMSLSNLASTYWRLDERIKAEQAQKRAINTFEKALYRTHPSVVRARLRLSEFQYRLNESDEALCVLFEALSENEFALNSPSTDVADIFFRLAAVHLDREEFDEAFKYSQQALIAFEKFLGPDNPDLADNIAQLATILRAKGQKEDADALDGRKQALLEGIQCLSKSSSAEINKHPADYYDGESRYIEPESLSERELSYRLALPDSEQTGIVDYLEHVARIYRSKWIYTDAWRYGEAAALLERALKIEEDAKVPDYQKIADRLDRLADLHEMYSEDKRYPDLYRRALEIRETYLDPGHPDIAKSLENVARLHSNLPSVDAYGTTHESDQFPLLKQALEIRENSLGYGHLDVAVSLEGLADLYVINDKMEEAEPLLKRVLDIRQHSLPASHPDVIRACRDLASFYVQADKPEEAEPLLRRLLPLQENLLGKEHPDVAKLLDETAEVYLALGKPDEALPHFEAALTARENLEVVSPLSEEDLGNNLVRIGQIYQGQGEGYKAEAALMRALKTQQSRFQPGDSRAAEALKALADLYFAEGRYEDARPLYEQLLDCWRNTTWIASLPLEVPETLNKLAEIFVRQGCRDEAVSLYSHALGVWESHLDPEKGHMTKDFSDLIIPLFDERGRDAEAAPISEQALKFLQNANWSEHKRLTESLEKFAVLLRDIGRDVEAEMLESEAKGIRVREHEPLSDSTFRKAQDLIDHLLSEHDPSESTKEELLGYRRDIRRGKFEEADFGYLKSMEKRLSKNH